MSKRISTDVRKKVACTLITSILVGSTLGVVSADNGFDNANYKDIGYVSVVGEVGKHGNAGFISTGEGDAGGKSYGLSQFTSKGGGASANGFVKWLKKYHPEMGKNFNGVGKAGTTSFDNAWKKTYNENKSAFGIAQMEYTGKNYVTPFVNKAKTQFGIDFSSTRALLELVYSTTVQFGVNGTLTVCKNAGINSSMTEEEILESATAEKIKSVGTYKFLGCSQDVRNSVKKRFSRELKEFKDITKGRAEIEGVGKITLDDLVSGNNTNATLDSLVNGETANSNSTLDSLVTGDNNDTNSNLDNLVNGDNNDTNSNLDNLVNGDNNDTNSNLDNLVNGDNNDTNSDSNNPIDEGDKDTNSKLDDLVNGDSNDTDLDSDNSVDGDSKENVTIDDTENTVETPNEDEETSNKETTLDDLVIGDDNSDNKDNNSDIDEDNKDVSDKEEDNTSKENDVESDAKDDNKEDTPVDEKEEDKSSQSSDKEDEKDKKEDSNKEDENKSLIENTNSEDAALTLEEKLESNMFGKIFKMTKEIMENKNGVDGVKAMYDLV